MQTHKFIVEPVVGPLPDYPQRHFYGDATEEDALLRYRTIYCPPLDLILRVTRVELNYIYLVPTPDCWCARFVGPHAEDTKHLFGTDCIPTAYTSEADPLYVQREIARRNKGVYVILNGVSFMVPAREDMIREAVRS